MMIVTNYGFNRQGVLWPSCMCHTFDSSGPCEVLLETWIEINPDQTFKLNI